MAKSVLEQKLDEFKAEMLAKFKLRAEKWGQASVTRDEFDWRGYPLKPIETSFLNEIAERFPSPGEPPANKIKEDVDVANMAFLDWALRKARAGKA